MKAQRGSRGITLLFLYAWHKMGYVVNTMPWLLYLWERELKPIVQRACLDGCSKPCPTDHPACGESPTVSILEAYLSQK